MIISNHNKLQLISSLESLLIYKNSSLLKITDLQKKIFILAWIALSFLVICFLSLVTRKWSLNPILPKAKSVSRIKLNDKITKSEAIFKARTKAEDKIALAKTEAALAKTEAALAKAEALKQIESAKAELDSFYKEKIIKIETELTQAKALADEAIKAKAVAEAEAALAKTLADNLTKKGADVVAKNEKIIKDLSFKIINPTEYSNRDKFKQEIEKLDPINSEYYANPLDFLENCFNEKDYFTLVAVCKDQTIMGSIHGKMQKHSLFIDSLMLNKNFPNVSFEVAKQLMFHAMQHINNLGGRGLYIKFFIKNGLVNSNPEYITTLQFCQIFEDWNIRVSMWSTENSETLHINFDLP